MDIDLLDKLIEEYIYELGEIANQHLNGILIFTVWNQYGYFSFSIVLYCGFFFGGSSVGTSQTKWA
ncbi:hypothetical protein [Peribacillus sp. NPDC097895]|uniref:hypothetical protein n=1 Tax=Peribacillus sp. NPDC097895 TaxID=3390619 RepID=UPI003D086C62